MEAKKDFSESTMQSLPSFDKTVGAIYFVANTPLSLYTMMRENYFVSYTLASFPASTLIMEFEKRASSPISTSEEVAEVYAIFIALTFKDKTEVGEFFKKGLDIKFEWFSHISKLYFDNYIQSPNYQTINIEPNILIEQQVYPLTEPQFKSEPSFGMIPDNQHYCNP